VASLIVREGPNVGRRIEVASALEVGRDGAELTLDDPEVSRRHASFRAVPGALEVTDLGSSNGTWVNGSRISAPTIVYPGDSIELGGTVLEVDAERAPRAATIIRSQPPGPVALPPLPRSAPISPVRGRSGGVTVAMATVSFALAFAVGFLTTQAPVSTAQNHPKVQHSPYVPSGCLTDIHQAGKVAGVLGQLEPLTLRLASASDDATKQALTARIEPLQNRLENLKKDLALESEGASPCKPAVKGKGPSVASQGPKTQSASQTSIRWASP
jgi:hypothetical protein